MVNEKKHKRRLEHAGGALSGDGAAAQCPAAAAAAGWVLVAVCEALNPKP